MTLGRGYIPGSDVEGWKFLLLVLMNIELERCVGCGIVFCLAIVLDRQQ